MPHLRCRWPTSSWAALRPPPGSADRCRCRASSRYRGRRVADDRVTTRTSEPPACTSSRARPVGGSRRMRGAVRAGGALCGGGPSASRARAGGATTHAILGAVVGSRTASSGSAVSPADRTQRHEGRVRLRGGELDATRARLNERPAQRVALPLRRDLARCRAREHEAPRPPPPRRAVEIDTKEPFQRVGAASEVRQRVARTRRGLVRRRHALVTPAR